MEETRVPGDNHWQIQSQTAIANTPRYKVRINLTTLLVIGTDCTSKSNYHLPWPQRLKNPWYKL